MRERESTDCSHGGRHVEWYCRCSGEELWELREFMVELDLYISLEAKL